MLNHDGMPDEDAKSDDPTLLIRELVSSRSDARPDDVAEHYSERGVALTLKLIPPDEQDCGRPLLLIEGDKRSLLFLADLLLAQAADPLDCGYQLAHFDDSPFFSERSEYGLYIHALPCAQDGIDKDAKGVSNTTTTPL